ncbi:MAG: ferritin-like domain-containing protein [Actinomycetota bacterium]|nr:ferritin-like domain-containing protein [Actinomycetota bacterium]
MAQAQGKEKIVQYLLEAHSRETAIAQTLAAHIQIAEPGPYRSGLEAHLRETTAHAQRVQQRLRELGAHRNVLAAGFGLAQNLITNTLSMAKAPIDLVRGGDRKEKMLKNARDEIMSEAIEIATYDAIERMARNVGDETTAQLAADIRADEERMLENLRNEIPNLTDAVVRAQVPIQSRPVLTIEDLPIANYDNLNADEITKRLKGLSQDELAQVAAYESTKENRKTILDRIESLEGDEPWPGYDDQTVGEINKALTDAPNEIVQQVRDYERSHKNRSSVLKSTDRELENA